MIVDTPADEQSAGVVVIVGTDGAAFTLIVTSEKHDKSEAVHLNTLAPTERPLTIVFGFVFETKVPVPETTLHVPVAGDEAAKVVDVTPHNDCTGPASQENSVVKLPASK